MSIRVRFAPSPTGSLHMGSARTALFNWLYARHCGGAFLLRIEDTDLERSTDASRDAIFDAMQWLGLDPDEEAVIQSSRRDEHVAIATRLLAEGKAYKCYCTADELAEMRDRAFASGRTRVYERTWRDRDDAPSGVPYTVRLKLPVDGTITLDDIVLGEITKANDDLDDFILLRSDGSPTYNFVVVCDDAFMGITHVVRGQDHVDNTFRQMHLYDALGKPRPRFAHLPLIEGLSKRKGSASVNHYRDAGYLREAVMNYVARLGWSFGDQEIFSPDELVEKFTLEAVHPGGGRYDDDKFAWVNTQWIKALPVEEIAARALPFFARDGYGGAVDAPLLALVEALQPRAATLVDMAAQARFAWTAPTEYDPKAVQKWIRQDAAEAYDALVAELSAITDFTRTNIEAAVAAVVERTGLGMGKIAQPVRIALTGGAVSPPIDVTMFAVGRDETLARLDAARTLFGAP
ncbi:MAG: glutamate--tRNA ligase [Myxococcales bacterium]|nr:glutamate--tRNA ligase [Myxococcales bacterium]